MTLDEINALLESTRIGRLSMADGEGRPYTIPLPFCWADGTVYMRVPLSGRKGQILAENNQVCFEVDRYTETFDDYASVLVEGRLVAVLDLAEKARVKELNDLKYNFLRGGHRPGHRRPSVLSELPMRKIQVVCIAGRRKEPDAAATCAAEAKGDPHFSAEKFNIGR
jgi:nitroimidazol reductase NimA-like FMN-containing flavoprotein (pyridoxamine 5'-phosphate oxidase superfamily)